MLEQQHSAIILPLLFLVILKLCDVARGVDLLGAPAGGSWAREERSDGAPLASPFTMIHGINYISLMYVYLGVTDSYEGSFLITALTLNPESMYFYLGIISYFLWFFLPLFEVQDYQQVSKTSVFSLPYSLWIHFTVVTLTPIIIRIAIPLREARPDNVNGFVEFLPRSSQS